MSDIPETCFQECRDFSGFLMTITEGKRKKRRLWEKLFSNMAMSKSSVVSGTHLVNSAELEIDKDTQFITWHNTAQNKSLDNTVQRMQDL